MFLFPMGGLVFPSSMSVMSYPRYFSYSGTIILLNFKELHTEVNGSALNMRAYLISGNSG